MVAYFAIAFVGVLFLIVTSVFGEVLDILNVDTDDGVSPLSGKVVAAALVAFGATGMLTSAADWSNGLGALTSGLVALLVGASVWWGTSVLYRQTASTDVSVSGMRGKLAEVTITIGPGAVGEVLLSSATSSHAMIARAADGSGIPVGSTVRIIEAVGNTVIVERVEHSAAGASITAKQQETGGSHG